MARVRKPTKIKEPVHLRMKALSDGSKSLYLDIYRDGKRTYEYLKMYIIPETDNNARKQNQVTMTAANAIKSKRIIELTNGEAGIETKEKVFLLDWMEIYKKNQEKHDKKDGNQIKVATRILKAYAGERTTLDQIDRKFCLDYIDYLYTEYRPKGKRLSNFTLRNYCRVLNSALNAAVRAKLIVANPLNELERSEKIRLPESKRSYMTIEEVRALIATPMKNEAVKSAYLFSCFCGLRVSDIVGLKWKDVFIDRGQYRLAVSMQKTKEPIYLPLSSEALKWMPERGDKTAEDHVFDLPSPSMMNILIKPWAKAAGIDKRFTFHTARHTFATMMLTLGADLYTTSKLLGHADVKMTQVYAKIINKKKDSAVNLVNGLFD
ncbi:site-specific integrase [Bacteroides acidifaciens]|uniref:site-specific integrase n=1 Tax=Bacteroides acidifaciens TaxID=85831 RepID=UPI0023D6CD57|nr:site-specific integrase [Bacteroides acidifaciens]MDE6820163.1 site-specific integrase [Bacteroides acidifaciens]